MSEQSERMTPDEKAAVDALIQALEAADISAQQQMIDRLKAHRCIGCGGPHPCYCMRDD